MTQVYFHCSNTKTVFVDHHGAVVDDLVEARDHATRLVQSFTNERSQHPLAVDAASSGLPHHHGLIE